MTAIAPVVVALLAGSDAAPAAVLAGWLAAAEAAYTHVEAECQVTRGRTEDSETYAGSFGGSYRLVTRPVGRPGLVRARLADPSRRAAAVQVPGGGWRLAGVDPVEPRHDGPGHPHAPCGLPGDAVGFRRLVGGRAGPVRLTAGERAGRPVWTAEVPLAPRPPPAPAGPGHLTLVLAADPPGLVLAATVRHASGERRCDIRYQPGGGWPAVRTVRQEAAHGTPAAGFAEVAEFTSYHRLDAPPPADRLSLVGLGVAEDPDTWPAAGPPADAPDGRWQWWAVAGIVAVGAVAFVRVGRGERGA